MRTKAILACLVLSVTAILSMGPGRCGTSAQGFFSDTPAPDMRGTWSVTYDNTISVEVDIGGAIYTGSITGDTGQVQLTHDGTPVTLDLDCSKPWVICPSEVFPAQVDFEQRLFTTRPHQVHMTIQDTECTGEMRLPVEADGECGGDTGVSCTDRICDGTVIQTSVDKLGSINAPQPEPLPNSKPDYTIGLLLSGGMALPTGNCLLIGGSTADADIEYDGRYDPETNAMTGTDLTDGVIKVVFMGGCFWAAEYAGTVGVALVGARVTLTTGFTATRQ